MTNGQSEAFSRVLIDKALEFSGWDLLDPKQALNAITFKPVRQSHYVSE